MKIYIDEDFRCHISEAEGLSPAETEFFDGKCALFIQGYRFVPAGESWTREDGTVFVGEMMAPAEDSRILEAAQAAYEEALEALETETQDMQSALEVLGVEP